MASDLQSIAVVLAQSGFVGGVWYVADVVLTSAVFRPLVRVVCGQSCIAGVTVDEDKEAKCAAWVSTFVYHAVQWAIWWVYTIHHAPWLWEWREWANHQIPRPLDQEGREAILPLYVMYFGFCLYSTFKDLMKKGKVGKDSKAGKGSFAWTFDVHHLIAIVLCAMSIHYGSWRAGFLTRMTHDPADVMLYSSFLYRARCERGNGSHGVLSMFFAANLVVWLMTRILLYGWVVVTNQMMFNDGLRAWLAGKPFAPWDGELLVSVAVQLLGCWVMLLLQVLWYAGLMHAAKKHFAGGSVVEDVIHGTSATQKKED